MGTYTRTYTWGSGYSSDTGICNDSGKYKYTLEGMTTYVPSSSGLPPVISGDTTHVAKKIISVTVQFWCKAVSSLNLKVLIGHSHEGDDPGYTMYANNFVSSDYQKFSYTLDVPGNVNLTDTLFTNFYSLYIVVTDRPTAFNLKYGPNYPITLTFTFTDVLSTDTKLQHYINNTWQPCVARYYNGLDWETCNIKYYNGSSWQNITNL